MSDKDTLLERRAGEENRNETLLEEGRFVDSVKTYNHCVCCIASVTVAPLAALLYHPVRYGIKAAYDSYDLRLTDRNLIWSSGYYGCCCCCWNESERIVPLEKITDVTYSQNWLQKLFGVDSLAVRTASGAVGGEGGGADISLEGLGDARRFRDAVMSAKAAREQSIAGSGSAPPVAMPSQGELSLMERQVRVLEALEARLAAPGAQTMT